MNRIRNSNQERIVKREEEEVLEEEELEYVQYKHLTQSGI